MWFEAATGLALRDQRSITVQGSALGGVTYEENGSCQLASLTPTWRVVVGDDEHSTASAAPAIGVVGQVWQDRRTARPGNPESAAPYQERGKTK